jgi:hypothetical protein
MALKTRRVSAYSSALPCASQGICLKWTVGTSPFSATTESTRSTSIAGVPARGVDHRAISASAMSLTALMVQYLSLSLSSTGLSSGALAEVAYQPSIIRSSPEMLDNRLRFSSCVNMITRGHVATGYGRTQGLCLSRRACCVLSCELRMAMVSVRFSVFRSSASFEFCSISVRPEYMRSDRMT